MNYYLSMGMSIDNTAARAKNFILTRRNQKGQVAIFVALIFQVIFIFFALLINVGLLVHHKINLQHSVDLAAYYGAMKQAEGMNTIAHVNYQIKQAWKLLTWRYRVLGTFGFTKVNGGGTAQFYPFESVPGVGDGWKYNGSLGVSTLTANGGPDMKCNNVILPDGTRLGVQDIPFFCTGHSGFANWPQPESMCQLNCDGFKEAKVINRIPRAGSNIDTGFGGNVAGAVNAAIDAVNGNLRDKCLDVGPNSANMLGRFLLGYLNEVTARTRTIELLAKNLSLEAEKVRDIEGKSILEGSEKTFKNNLTGANFQGLVPGTFQTYNGLSDQKCRFNDGLGTNTEFLKKIEFDFINYFTHNCRVTASGYEFKPEPVYNPDRPSGLSDAFDTIPQEVKNVINSFLTPGQRHTVGYEKNPHCVEYYAVKAVSQPNIPFLPLAKVTLKASAVAKPFGGTIGPWYGKTWPIGSPTSIAQPQNNTTQVDETLPDKKFQPGAGNDIVTLVYSLPNFSHYVGDKLGLRDLDYIAAYHSMLQIRDISTYGSKNYSQNVNSSGRMGHVFVGTQPVASALPAKYWPSTNDWENVAQGPSDFKDYDSMAKNSNESGMRAVEITAIAPNQFDILHYSIDPDFYNNYYVRLYKGIDAIKSAVGGGNLNKDQIRADFGAVGMQPSDPEASAPMVSEKTFSVKDQILLKNTVLNVSPTYGAGKPSKTYKELMQSLISVQSSLLTGWTFASYSDYSKFPNDPVNDLNQTMSFGQCGNEWNKTTEAMGNQLANQNFGTPLNIDTKLPPVPGNCVTGGRTGYSVKMVSPSVLFEGSQTPIENSLPKSFFNF